MGGGAAVPGDAGRCWKVGAGYCLRKMRLLLLAGMSTWKHRAGGQGGGPHRCGDCRPLPADPSTYHPLQVQPVGLSQLPQQRRVPKAPGGIAAGEGGVGQTDGHLTPALPEASPSPGGAPRWGGLPPVTALGLVLKDHAGRELLAAAGSTGRAGSMGRTGHEQPWAPQTPPPTSASGCGQSPRCSGG